MQNILHDFSPGGQGGTPPAGEENRVECPACCICEIFCCYFVFVCILLFCFAFSIFIYFIILFLILFASIFLLISVNIKKGFASMEWNT